jgi:hypothetical protein
MNNPIPFPLFMALCDHKEKSRSSQEIQEMAGEAIREWLAAQEQRALAAHQPAALLGYQWKSLFLPDGTILRAVLSGKQVHAIVEGNCIVFDGKPVSPSGFVNAVGRTVRNAWTSIWILFPQQSVWKLAADCRDSAPRRSQCRNDGATG